MKTSFFTCVAKMLAIVEMWQNAIVTIFTIEWNLCNCSLGRQHTAISELHIVAMKPFMAEIISNHQC